MIAKTHTESRELAERETGTPAPRVRKLVPAVDIYEDEQSVVLLADVPGVAEDGIDITVDRGVLTLHAHTKQTAPAGFKPIYEEYVPADYERQFTLGDAIDSARISASVTNGVLKLELPKAARAVPRKISVKAG
jgi:HSP20 family molecular chaperone IbpA